MGAEGESSVPAAAGEQVNINIRCSSGSKFSVKTSLESTVGEFKGLLAQNCDVPAEQQRLIYKGRILKDDQTLVNYGLQADHTVHLVRGSAPAASPPAAVPPSAENTNHVPSATQGGNPNTGGAGLADTTASLFPGIGLGALGATGASGLFGAGLPEFERVQQQQLTQNPNMMRDIMNMPAIQNLMNNPEIMRSLIMSNPQMREIIDRNPELAHILNDPGILRQTLEAARNPELMREMMRNTDRAMSNIESSPEGFNMLRRMYENVQEPFLNATTMGGRVANDAGSNPFAALLGNQGGTQAREGHDSSSAAGPEMTTGTTVPNSNPLPNPWSNTGGGQTNNATRTNPTGEARVPSVVGLGGLGLPELERMGIPDPSAFSQLLQNPAVTQMMQSLLSDPQYLDQILGLNPQLRSMFDTTPQLREMMQNPEILRELTSPNSMQQMMALQQQLSQLTRQQSSNLHAAETGQGRGPENNPSLDLLMNMFGGLGAGSTRSTPDGRSSLFLLINSILAHTLIYLFYYPVMTNLLVHAVSPEQLYATQLTQLQEMGFYDTQENIQALRATSGNVHAAVERLLGNPGQ